MLDFRTLSTYLFKTLSTQSLKKNVQSGFPVFNGHSGFKILDCRSIQDSFHTSKKELLLNFSAPGRHRNVCPDNSGNRIGFFHITTNDDRGWRRDIPTSQKKPSQGLLSSRKAKVRTTPSGTKATGNTDTPIDKGPSSSSSTRPECSTQRPSQGAASSSNLSIQEPVESHHNVETESIAALDEHFSSEVGVDPYETDHQLALWFQTQYDKGVERNDNFEELNLDDVWKAADYGESSTFKGEEYALFNTNVVIPGQFPEQAVPEESVENPNDLKSKGPSLQITDQQEEEPIERLKKFVGKAQKTLQCTKNTDANTITSVESLAFYMSEVFVNLSGGTNFASTYLKSFLNPTQQAQIDWHSASEDLKSLNRPGKSLNKNRAYTQYNVKQNDARIKEYEARNKLKENLSEEKVGTALEDLDRLIRGLYKAIPDINTLMATFQDLTDKVNKAEALYQGSLTNLTKIKNQAEEQEKADALELGYAISKRERRELKSRQAKLKSTADSKIQTLSNNLHTSRQVFQDLSAEKEKLESEIKQGLHDFDSSELETIKQLRACLLAGVSTKKVPPYFIALNNIWFELLDPTMRIAQISYNEDRHTIDILYSDMITVTEIYDPPVPRIRINERSQGNAAKDKYAWLYWLKQPDILGDYLPETFVPNAIEHPEPIRDRSGHVPAVCQVWRAHPEEKT